MIMRFVWTMIIVSLTACSTVSHVPLSEEASTQLKGKTITTTRYPKSDFSAFTSSKAAFAMVGAVAMISEGNEIVKTNNIEDPALKIAKELTDKLATARGMRLIPAGDKAAQSDDISVLLTTYPKADYVLDVKTTLWMFNYYPTDWSHYKVTYNARLRLIESSTNNVLAQALCKTVQGDDKNPPTKDQLLENHAKLLKEYLNKAASACGDLLSKDVLKL